MGDFEAIGDAATGGLLARAGEKKAGEQGADGHAREENCLNCGTPLAGDYCHSCGQHAHVHRTLAAWWHDFAHSVLHIDGKFWPTLGMLAWRPGELTRRYAHGERLKFVSPLALFLFTVFLMFATFSILGGPFTPNGSPQFDQAVADSEEEVAQLRGQIRDLEKRTGAANDGGAVDEVNAELAELRRELAAIELARANIFVPSTSPDPQSRSALSDMQPQTGWVPLDRAIDKARGNPSLLIYKVQANAYKFSWALIPLSVPFLWALFLHRRRYRKDFTSYDHLVFVTYSIAFMSIVGIVFTAIEAAGLGGSVASLGFLLVPPLHMYRQLKGAYGLSRGSAAWRTVALLLFAALALAIFAILLLAIGTLG